jgi:hypothetical protein
MQVPDICCDALGLELALNVADEVCEFGLGGG